MIKDLGFIVTKDLNFDQHCEQIAMKATGVMVKLFKVLTTRDSQVLLTAHKTYVRPLLEYGTVIFSPYKRKVVEELERVQNSFTRKLFIRTVGFMYDNIPPAEERNMNLGLKPLAWRRRKFDLLMF
ncbi:hypothetical protein Y032_0008g328 [Ancylostoma ceylanicum]|uniref:Uncharacterized protein n=1 Tax=Ancylostoma ceylanicum TaxID=53326 RepID=A0A016VLC9_9BILA|nr:hypothetical protein Y032_0008g328 [Ancylostoma ceylanicum]